MLALALMRCAPEGDGRPVVHVAPERALGPLMRGRYGEAWTPADIDIERYTKGWMNRPVMKLDLALPGVLLPDSLRGLVHSHVLEHVPAPLGQVLEMMNAAVSPGGFHAFIVPGPFPAFTEEDLEGRLSAAERESRYGHPEHVRIFGHEDWEDRVGRHFQGWRKIDMARTFTKNELREAAIPAGKTLDQLTGSTVHLYVKE